ncbi:MAG: nucleotidyltransferase domain-containing protein [Treponema sp.]|nr:nucleotidyltransferase domain-containing protein [Treponema sp.]
MQYGLSGETLRELHAIFLKYKNIRQVIIHGSRAKGNYRQGSDIDLALKTDGDFGFTELLRLCNDFDDSDLPYFVDVLIYDTISNPELKAHIDRVGKVLYPT